ncbi:MAG TPA: tripartite tricarboxylate transporter TctB family protein, partial [Novosphingobium sp.]|nr:tripartite tricarboxylate transporter TctB family protein [Novosphingobium sp.]
LIGVVVLRRVLGVLQSSLVVPRPVFVVATAALLVAQAALFPLVGAILCVAGFSLAILLACGERRLAHLIGVPLALTGFIYVVFVMALGVNLP